MFSREEKMKISGAIEKMLLELNHPEMPTEKPNFTLHVNGKEGWSWADIEPNWHYEDVKAPTSDWNEGAREALK